MSFDALQSLPSFGATVLSALLVASAYTFALAVAAARGRPRLLQAARLAAYATSAIALLGVALLAYAFVAHDFRIRYVARYSDRSMTLTYLLTALWGGQDGSLLWWLLLQCGFLVAVVRWMRGRYRALQPYVIATLAITVAFFAVLMSFAANPFETFLSGPRPEGQGLNPLLQNYWMILHPPALYLGFVGCTVPFAFAVAALFSGRLDSEWVVATRKWMLLAWLFLSIGNALGMIWAYEELGWGGWWAWDPVENSGLLPWLAASAYVHSTIIQERRNRLKVWNVVLICLTFLLTLFGTFLTRSGIIASVHSFAASDIGSFFVWAMLVVAVTCTALIVWRWPQLRARTQLETLASREASFVINNWALVSLLAFVAIATSLPLLTEWLRGDALAVGPPFFNRWAKPFGILLFLLMGLCPLFGWGKTSTASLRRSLPVPLGAVLVGTTLHIIFGRSLGMPPWVEDEPSFVGALGILLQKLDAALPAITVALVWFNLAVLGQEFVRGVAARRRTAARRDAPENHFTALLRLIGRNRRRYGGYVVHVGVTCMFLGFVGTAWVIHHETTLRPGETHHIGPYDLTYLRSRLCPGDPACSTAEQTDRSKQIQLADLSVSRHGAPIATVSPARFTYRSAPDLPTTEVGLHRGLLDDLYVVSGFIGTGDEPTSFRLYVNPLVSWIWIGLLMLIGGASISLWPETATTRLGAWDYVRPRSPADTPSAPVGRVLRAAPWAIPLAGLLALVLVGARYSPAWAIWLLAAAALLSAILLLWESLLASTATTRLTLEEALTMAAPTAAEEQKRAVLRSLKDLDYELALGKIDAADHAALAAQYRRQASQLLREVDAGLDPWRTRAEKQLRRRLLAAGITVDAPGLTQPAEPDSEPTGPDPERDPGSAGAST